MRYLIRLVVVGAMVVGGLATVGGPAQAASLQSSAIFTLNSTGVPGYLATQQRFGDAGSFDMTPSQDVPGGIYLSYRTATYEAPWGIDLAPPAGQSFHPGYYPNVSYRPAAGQAFGEVWVGSQNEGYLGDMDVLDWVPGPHGLPSRFDIVFRDGTRVPGQYGYFGELRLGEPGEGAVHLGSRHIEWPSTAVTSTPIRGTEWLHNTSGSAVAIGAPQVTGVNSADWRVSANGCTGRLAAGATCSMVLGFSPTAGGPRLATLSVPVGGQVQVVSLAGDAALGTSSLTFSGNDWVSHGATHSFPNGPYVMSAAVDPVWHSFSWTETIPYVSYGSSGSQPLVEMSAPGGAPLAVGTHATVATRLASGSQYGEDTDGFGRGCGDYAGSITVHAFTEDATGAPAMADIDYTQRCKEDPNPNDVMTANLLWQYRSDTMPPRMPTGITVTGSSVHWARSTSSDAVESIARLVPGTGQGATPTTGYPLSSGSATAATLPALTAGETYTVEVFAVDATGNASSAAKRSLVG